MAVGDCPGLERSIARREGWWLRVTWVRLAFFLGCVPAVADAALPAYSLGEAFVWFRFLFAMAVAFWLGKDKRFVYAMLLSVGLGDDHCAILAEMYRGSEWWQVVPLW